MKQKFDVDIFEIPSVNESFYAQGLDNIIASDSIIASFNDLLEYFEDKNTNKNGILFVCNHDVENTVMFQHLVLFADHYKIRIFSLRKTSKQILEAKLNQKKVFLVFVKESDENYSIIKQCV